MNNDNDDVVEMLLIGALVVALLFVGTILYLDVTGNDYERPWHGSVWKGDPIHYTPTITE